jgi:hypothetical protein
VYAVLYSGGCSGPSKDDESVADDRDPTGDEGGPGQSVVVEQIADPGGGDRDPATAGGDPRQGVAVEQHADPEGGDRDPATHEGGPGQGVVVDQMSNPEGGDRGPEADATRLAKVLFWSSNWEIPAAKAAIPRPTRAAPARV